jgi:catechol 2,3-dioxygenase-like lactoylglutathione lyase family enzyme
MKLLGTHHIQLQTPNFAALKAFYTEQLGFPIVHSWPDANIIFISLGSTTLELADRPQSTANNKPTGGFTHIALHVENVDEAVAELVAKGIAIHTQPRDFQDIRLAFIQDPDGNMVELVHPTKK